MKPVAAMAFVSATLLPRLKWTAYRCQSELGLPGLAACAFLLVVILLHIGLVAPCVRRHDAQLRQLIAGQASGERELARMLGDGHRKNDDIDHGAGFWDILERHRLSPGEVKHRQLPGKKTPSDAARNLISLPSTGDYSTFRSALKELAGVPDVAVETFSLSRKSHADRLLAIDLTLSVSTSTLKPGTQQEQQ